MTTVTEIVSEALSTAGIVGVGQAPLAEDSNKGLFHLNLMIDEWRTEKLYIYGESDVSFVGTGAQSYTIGTGGTVNVTRPSRIQAAFRRQLIPSNPNLVDQPLTIINSREDYNRIALKTLSPVPTHLFYDQAYPLGVLYPWPVPSSAYEIHMSVLRDLAPFVALTDTIVLPPPYSSGLFWNLTKRLRIAYRRPIDVMINLQAKNGRAAVMKANLSIPTLVMPRGLPGMGGGSGYNVYSDQFGR